MSAEVPVFLDDVLQHETHSLSSLSTTSNAAAVYDWHRNEAERNGMAQVGRTPSEYIREQCYWGCQLNPVGVRMRHEIGVNWLTWATDFPHQGTEWPNTRSRVIARNFAGVPEEETNRMVFENVCEFFGLDRELYL